MHERDEERDRGNMIETRDDTGATRERRGPKPRQHEREREEGRHQGNMKENRSKMREKRAEAEVA